MNMIMNSKSDTTGLLKRQHVDDLLAEAIKRPVTTVIAGTGYGKTQAVSSFVRERGLPAIWIKLTSQDNYAIRFWENMMRAMEHPYSKLAERLKKLGFPDSIEKINYFLQLIANASYTSGPMLFVFDDFYHIQSKQIKNLIENLIITDIENLSLIFISRFAPDIDFYNLCNNQSPARITTGDLQFSPDETQAFFEMHDVILSDDALNKIYAATEGWPIAVHLVAMWLAGQGGVPDEDPASYTIPLVFDLIEQEVFRHYSLDIQHLLIKLSLLEDFPVELLKKIAGEHFADIINVLNRNIFVYFNSYSKTYSFHQLFLGFLRGKQDALPKSEKHLLYLEAARWYQKQGNIIETCTYFNNCHHYDDVWNIIRPYGSCGWSGEIAGFYARLIDGFPAEFIEKNQIIRVFKMHLLLVMADIEGAHNGFLALEKEFLAWPETEERNRLLGEVYIGLAHTNMILKSYDFKKSYEQADRFLPGPSVIISEKINYVENHNALVLFSYEEGEVDRMLATLSEIMPTASKCMNGCAAGMEYLAQTEAAYFRHELDDAIEYAHRAIERAQTAHQHDIICNSYFMLMRIYFVKGDCANALLFLNKLREHMSNLSNINFHNVLDIAESWYYCMIGRPEKVAKWILDDALNSKMHAPISICRDQLSKSFYLLRSRKYYELLALLDEMDAFYTQRNVLILRLQSHVLKSVCLFKTESKQKAVRALEAAYKMSVGNRLIFPYVEIGKDILSFLEYAIDSADSIAIPQSWLRDVYTKAVAFSKVQAQAKAQYEESLLTRPVPQLTEPEKEILDNLCLGLTREEIAKHTGVSLYTLKDMLANIYRKLGAINQSDAVRIAKSGTEDTDSFDFN
ncbi:MAG: LuxR C-terminal-related transcriptional regulator [Christensenellaceae bacterium]|jgi:LuxR family maltose regulon positive regulatory protein